MRRCLLLFEVEDLHLLRLPHPASPPSTLRKWLLGTKLDMLFPRDQTWFYYFPKSNFFSNNRLSCLQSIEVTFIDSNFLPFIFLDFFDNLAFLSLKRKKNNKERFLLTDISNNSPYSLTHLKNLPPKNCTPIIENISQNTRQTRSTLNILGIAYINAFTTI